jgi:hypothetical protein
MPIEISKEDAERLRQIEIKKLVDSEWTVLHEQLPVIQKPERTRKNILDIPTMDKIKTKIYERLGDIAPFIFIHIIGTICGWLEGPYRNVEKILLILYMIVENESFGKVDERSIIPKSTIWRIHDTIFNEYYDQLNEWATNCLSKMFSNPIIRILTARIENNPAFNFGTMFLDGHDSRIEYGALEKYPKSEYWSFKFKKSGVRTQVLMDCQELAIAVSKTLPSAPNSDIGMFKQMGCIPKIMEPSVDVLFFDGGYFLGMQEYIEKIQGKGYEFDESNFRTPIRKPRKKDLTGSELQYNSNFGAFRGMIETLFSHLGEKFKYFAPNAVIKQGANFEKIWNLKIKISFVLMNIDRFVRKYDIKTLDHHKEWRSSEFDFPSETPKPLPPSNAVRLQNELSEEKRKVQDSVITKMLGLTDSELLEMSTSDLLAQNYNTSSTQDYISEHNSENEDANSSESEESLLQSPSQNNTPRSTPQRISQLIASNTPQKQKKQKKGKEKMLLNLILTFIIHHKQKRINK